MLMKGKEERRVKGGQLMLCMYVYVFVFVLVFVNGWKLRSNSRWRAKRQAEAKFERG